jgi:hypothetical protein
MIPCVDIFMTTKKFRHCSHSILAGFIHHNLLSEWFKSFKHLSTSILIDVLNFLPENKKKTLDELSLAVSKTDCYVGGAISVLGRHSGCFVEGCK